jgi:hypothetical protein
MNHLQSLSGAQLLLRKAELQDEIDAGENTPITEQDFRREVTAIDAELSRRATPSR